MHGSEAESGAKQRRRGGVRRFRLEGRAISSGRTATVTLRLDYDGTVGDARLAPAAGRPHDSRASREAANEVGRAFGVMYARVRADRERSAELPLPARAADSLRRFDLGQHIQVRECLERTTATIPTSPPFGLLAFV